MVAGIKDEVEVGSSYKETSGGSDGAGAEKTAIELILSQMKWKLDRATRRRVEDRMEPERKRRRLN